MEDDHYGVCYLFNFWGRLADAVIFITQSSRHNHTHNGHYPHTVLPPFQSTQEPDWHSYTERTHVHHR
jgi:hypothetical protein